MLAPFLLQLLMVTGIRHHPGIVTVERWWHERGVLVFVTTLA